MCLPRFRLRTMMVAVAVVALVFGGVLWTDRIRRQSAYYMFVAKAYELEAKNSHHPFISILC